MEFENILIFDTKEKIEAEIKLLEGILPTIKGTQTEVYSRIVGYYRSVGNWNQGKSQEWEERKPFDVEKSLLVLKNKQEEGVA